MFEQETKYRSIGTLTPNSKIDLPADAVSARLRRQKGTDRVYVEIDLSGAKAYPIPEGALVDVEIRDNAMMSSVSHPKGLWGSAELKCIVIVDRDFRASRNTVTVSFVDPETAVVHAISAAMHVPEADGQSEDSGNSYIRFHKEPLQEVAASVDMRSDGPWITLGKSGPANGGECERDPAFLRYALPNMIRLFVINLVAAPEGFDGPRWSLLRTAAANWAGFENWDALYDVARDNGDGGVKVSELCANGLVRSAGYMKIATELKNEDRINAA